MSASRALNAPTAFASPPRFAVAKPTRGDDSVQALAKSLAPMLTSIVVAVLVVLSIHFGRSADGVVVLWLPAAIAAVAWLRGGRGLTQDLSFGVLITVGILVGELLSGHPLGLSAMLTVANMVEIVAAVVLVRRFAPGASLQTVKATFRLLLLIAVIAPVLGGLAGAACFGLVNQTPFLSVFQTWWFGHALGMSLTAPLLLSIDRHSLSVFRRPWRCLEWLVLIGAFGAIAFAIYQAELPIGFVLNAMMAVIAVRLRIAGVATAMLLAAGFMFFGILYGAVPYAVAGVPEAQRLITAQLILLSVSLPFMMVASILRERDRLTARARAGQERAELASEAKSRLLANVAHEIKSPVAGVIGIGELWSSGQLGPVTPTQGEMAEMLVKTARQVETLAHDLLDVARAEAGRVEVDLRPTDVCGVVEDVCLQLRLRPEAQGLRLDTVCEDEGLVAMADSVRLAQVVSNLASNAAKYGASGGEVVFRIRRHGDDIRLEVIDKGPGLSAEKQAQLFEPFNRLGLERSTIEGHGIGLTLAKRLTELMGGAMGVISAPGEGAAFWIELPAA